MQRQKSRTVFALAVLLAMSSNLSLLLEPVKAACCYFAAKDKDINQPGQKAFISWNPKEQSEAFTVQPKFEGNAVDFGMVIPTPARPKLDEMPRDFFKDLAMYTILMPLPQPIYGPEDPQRMYKFRAKNMGASMASLAPHRRNSVMILESGVVGSLDYKIIVASDATGLFDWLKENHYSYGGDEATLQFYIKKKWFFTVMKIDPKQMKTAANGSYTGEVTPTRFAFKSSDCIYPLKITQMSVKDKTDALFYVQAPNEMDLQPEISWMHSYRAMYLTYMLGCCANPEQQQELAGCNQWLATKCKSDWQYETTKLEWAKQLHEAELSVLEDPEKNYAQMGSGDLPPGAKVVSLKELLDYLRQGYLKQSKEIPDYVKNELKRMEDQYQPARGMIVQNDPNSVGTTFVTTHYSWYANREAPLAEIKGLSRLKGHLKKDQWLTKFRRTIRKDEMTNDLVLAEVPKEKQQSYTRIMPTSPP